MDYVKIDAVEVTTKKDDIYYRIHVIEDLGIFWTDLSDYVILHDKLLQMLLNKQTVVAQRRKEFNNFVNDFVTIYDLTREES